VQRKATKQGYLNWLCVLDYVSGPRVLEKFMRKVVELQDKTVTYRFTMETQIACGMTNGRGLL